MWGQNFNVMPKPGVNDIVSNGVNKKSRPASLIALYYAEGKGW